MNNKTALLISHHGAQAKVRDDTGIEFQVQVRQSFGDLVAGDQVFLRGNGQDEPWVIVGREERNTEIFRTDKRGTKKRIAANLDALLIVIASEPEPYLNLIDRYLAAAEIFGLSPAIVINKSDLGFTPVLDEVQRIYPGLGYPVFKVSSHSGHNLLELAHWMQEKKLAFVGQSGVGKSSLINGILKDSIARVGVLSDKRAKGRHTTTASHVYQMAGHGWIMDSPGIREFGNSDWTPQEILRGFPEIFKVSEFCQYRNCAHGIDKGCAVQEAFSSGKIEASRFKGFLGLVDEKSGSK